MKETHPQTSELDRCRAAWRRAAAPLCPPAPPAPDELERRCRLESARMRRLRRLDRYAAAASLFLGLVVSPAAAAAVSRRMPAVDMRAPFAADRAAICETAHQICTLS